MTAPAPRTFEDKPGVREKTPLLVGIAGPSGTGKTYSALRVATGIQRVVGGDIFVIDTEHYRALHYAEQFKFRHVPFAPPFAPLDYLAALGHCAQKGAGVVVVDSMSHEHDGPGGVLEMHEAEVERLAKLWNCSPYKVQIPAWSVPKAQRRKLINGILQLGCNAVFCFRAKEKLKIISGKDPVNLGWMPIAGEEFIFEMTLKCVLLPGADGVPTWHSENEGERAMMKLPGQFRELFRTKKEQLSEDIGEQLARWAAGSAPARTDSPVQLLADYQACATRAAFDGLEAKRKAVWESLNPDQQKKLKTASDAAAKRLPATPAGPQPAEHVPGVDDPANDPPAGGKLFSNDSGTPH